MYFEGKGVRQMPQVVGSVEGGCSYCRWHGVLKLKGASDEGSWAVEGRMGCVVQAECENVVV